MNDFTLFVMVRDRHYNLPRIIKYYADLTCEKIIFDSSKSKYTESTGTFKYCYFGPLDYFTKINRITTSIDTPFMLDNPDDDITLKSGIIECLNFLRTNPNYTSCDGMYYTLTKKNLTPKSPNKFFGALKADFQSDDSIARTADFMQWCNAKNHAILRTDAAKHAYHILNNYSELRTVNCVERILNICLAIYGNQKVLPLAYQIRSPGDRLVTRASLKKELRLGELLAHKLNESLAPVARLMCDHSKLEYAEALQTIVRILRSNLQKSAEHTHVDTTNWPTRLKFVAPNVNDLVAARQLF